MAAGYPRLAGRKWQGARFRRLARGQPIRMEGGVGLILLLFIVVAAGFAIAMYLTGGALLSGSRRSGPPPSEKADPVERSDVYTDHDELR
jgi:hypothetical protein